MGSPSRWADRWLTEQPDLASQVDPGASIERQWPLRLPDAAG